MKSLWRRWSNGRTVEWASPHSPTLTSLHLSHSSFSNPSVALSTSQLILIPFCCFTYVIGTSAMSQLILQPFRRFTYVMAHYTALLWLHLRHMYFTYITAHSPTLPLLHLCHRSFHNPSVASPTSQVLHLASRPCIGGWKNSLWWTSLLQQVTKFRSSYSFG